MSLMIDNPLRSTNRHRARGPRPGPGEDAPAPGAEATVSSEIEWAECEEWSEDEPDDAPECAPRECLPHESTPRENAPEPQPMAATAPQFGGGPAVPPTRTVASFPPIRAGGGRHRLPSPVRRRPGPIAAGLMVAATTLAVGSLRGPLLPAGSHGVASAPLLARDESGHSYE
jgi:hypothetical protein